MAKLKMIGIIKENEMTKYEKYDTKEKMTSISNGNIQIKAIPICIFFSMLCNFILFFKVFTSSIKIGPVFVVIGFLISFLLLVVHEILHGIIYPKNVNVYIGFVPPITFVALASYPMSKKRFILMCLLPFVLGLIPLLIAIISNNSMLCSFCIGLMFMGMISPYPDVYNVIQVIKKVPKGKKVLFYEDDLVYID